MTLPGTLAPDSAEIQLSRLGAVAIVTLARSKSLNAFNLPAYRKLGELFRQLATDDEIRAVVLTGAPRPDGRACFCAGADLRDGALEEGSLLAREAYGLVERLPKPVVAAIGGVAVGGGLELALRCDLRVAAESARIGLPEINIGSMPRAGGTQRLPALIGESRAKELLFTGALIDGREAARIGLVNRAVSDGQEFAVALELAQQLAAKAPLALAAIKQAIHDGRDAPDAARLDLEIEAGRRLDGTADRIEGRRAFLERRPPVFRGR